MDVRDIMTRNPISIDPNAVDDQGAVVGIITDRDLRSAALAPALEQYLSNAARRRLRGITTTLEALRVKDAMTGTPIITRPDPICP
jgi:CBS domain-containing protein